MIYKMNRKQFTALGNNKEEILDSLNERLGHPNIKQTPIVAEDYQTKAKQRIKTEPIRIITDIIITGV